MNTLFALILFAAGASAVGLLLAWLSQRLHQSRDPEAALTEAINTLLPQTQCAQCGYPGCRPYAVALSRGEAAINLCPPGGAATQEALAELLGLNNLSQRQSNGPLQPAPEAFEMLAVIDEAQCIGCALCLPACPVDAIVGAPRFMHTVLSEECTGCELCIEPCPMDCIAMVPVT